MMRDIGRRVLAASAVTTLMTMISAAPVLAQARPAAPTSADDIVCNFSGDCEVGPEKGFSLRTTTTTPPAGNPAANPAAKAVARRPAANRTAAAAAAPRAAGNAMDMRVTFELGSADLTEEGKAAARAFAQALQSPRLAGMRFTVDGHTDAKGDRSYNIDLSRRRAEAVTSYLVANGADPARLEARGHGFDQPRPGLSRTDAGNRRVEIARRD